MMQKCWALVPLLVLLGVSCAKLPTDADRTQATSAPGSAENWCHWRGPDQNGTSSETGLPETVSPDQAKWVYELSSRGTPVIADGRLYTIGYRGKGPDMQEVLLCLDAQTGRKRWEHGFNDFLSDIIYNRYSIGSPAIDPETGHVYMMSSAGIVSCFTASGTMLWQHSMMEQFGRLTFPNGRTGSPVIDGDLVIVRGITSNWGRQGPARDRFYAFDKRAGELVWSSAPGVGPPFLKDSSFSTPVLANQNGRRVFYAGTGCGNVVCVDARTGDPIWRFQMSYGGVNSTVLHFKDRIIAIHGRENLDDSTMGRMVAIRPGTMAHVNKQQVVLDRSTELWRNDLGIFTSSPVLVGDRVYQCTATGELACVDAGTGQVLWHKKLGPDQLHASPLAADGKLYVPIHNGLFYILRPSDKGAEVLSKVKLEGACLGAPAVWNGNVYVHTTKKLYCFGGQGAPQPRTRPQMVAAETLPEPDRAVRLQVVPSEVLLRPNDRMSFAMRALDANGRFLRSFSDAFWSAYIPPTAKVKSKLDAAFNPRGELIVGENANLSAGAFEASVGNLKGYFRGRVLPTPPFAEDFESFEVTVPHKSEQGVKFAYPPLPWIGARFKWEIRELDGNKVLAKTLDRILFQRAMTFFGHPDEKSYTVAADVMTDGNRRLMSAVGLINQRYIIALVGNWQQIEVNSNHDRLKVGLPFKIKPKVWYRLKSRVDVYRDGRGVVRAKAWPRDEPEPEAWTIQVPHKHAHTHGAPGLFGFSPQSRFRVYIDNVSVTSNE